MANERTTEIEVVSAPDGYDKADYQFFKNNSTGQLWKAAINILPAFAPVVNGDIEAAPTQLAVAITVSPIDAKGKALRENDKPIIIDAHLHTFTQVEMAEPDFDPTNRIMQIVTERIHIGEARIDAVKKINAIGEAWTKKAKIKAGKFTYREVPAENLNLTNDGAPISIVAGDSVTAPAPQISASGEAPPASETDV